MAGEGGKLEEVGGSSETKARIAGKFTGILLAAVAAIILAVISFLVLTKGKSLPGASEQENKHSLIIEQLPARPYTQTPS